MWPAISGLIGLLGIITGGLISGRNGKQATKTEAETPAYDDLREDVADLRQREREWILQRAEMLVEQEAMRVRLWRLEQDRREDRAWIRRAVDASALPPPSWYGTDDDTEGKGLRAHS